MRNQPDRGVFERMDALGLEFAGPQHLGGRLAAPPPQGVSEDTRNVPTYHTTRRSPATAEKQLGYGLARSTTWRNEEPATTAGY